jgi:hypothetical protein
MQAKDEHAGLRTKCPSCGTLLDIPKVRTTEQPPPAPVPPAPPGNTPPVAAAWEEEEERVAPAPPPKERGATDAGILGGIGIMVLAVVWFVVGLACDRIFFYPPILFVIGLIALCKGILNLGKPRDD